MHRSSQFPWILGLVGGLAAACSSGANPSTPAADGAVQADAAVDAGPQGLPVLGNGTHSADAVSVRVIATADDTLATPRDLAFNPDSPRDLYITNFADSSVTILRNTGAADQTADNRAGAQHTHFMSHPAAIAFGASGMLATAQEEDQPTQGPVAQGGTPADFMGPTLFLSGYDDFDGGHASHIDMLHNSPNATGIAWESDNIFWVVDGYHQSLTRYDFHQPHEPGGVDHGDGTLQRFVQGEISYTPGLSGHAEYDQDSHRLFFADPGNHRVAVLDPSTAMPTTRISPNYDSSSSSSQRMMMGAETQTILDGTAMNMMAPSGLALDHGRLYVSDNASSRIYAITLTGEVIDYLDLSATVPPGGLQGLTLDAEGRIYVVDSVGDRVIEVAAR